MAHILRRLGEAALLARRAGSNNNIWLPPIVSRRRAMEIREEWLAEGECVRPRGGGTPRRSTAPQAACQSGCGSGRRPPRPRQVTDHPPPIHAPQGVAV